MPLLGIPSTGRVQHHKDCFVVNHSCHEGPPATLGVVVPAEGKTSDPFDCRPNIGGIETMIILDLRSDPIADVQG